LGRVLESHTEIHDLVSRTLQWLACAIQPLSGRALLEALAITPGDTCFDPDAMTSENEILRWCSSLVRRRATGDGIELAHFTVKEYLLSIEPTKDPRLALFKICTEDSALLLGQVCLTYLNLDELGKSPPPENIFDDIWSGDSDLELEEGNKGYGECSEGDYDDDEDNESSDEESDSMGTHESLDGTSGDDNSSRMQKGKPQGSSLIGREIRQQKKPKKPADAAFAPWCDKYPLLMYAAPNWDSHLRSYHQDPLVVHLSHKLFDPRKSYQFLWWSYACLSDALCDGWDSNLSDTATLHWAALLSRHEVCSWLLQEGSDVNRISELGSPLDCAILGITTLWRFNEDDLIDRMEENFDFDVETERVLRSTATTVHHLLRAGARVDKITDPDFAVHPLKMALILECHNPELISYLLDAGALIDEPILELVDRFLASYPDCVSNATVPRGIRAIFSGTASQNVSSAVRPLYQRIVRQLSAQEAESDLSEQLGAQFDIEEARQDFLQASEHGVCRSVSSLMSSLRKLDPEGAEPTLTLGLLLALHNNHADVVYLLLSNGLNPNEVDADGNSSVHRFLITHVGNDVRITIQNIKKLVEYGADLTMRNKSGECLLHVAAKSKHDGLLKAIFELVTTETTQSLLAIINPSPLQYAIAWGCDENVEILVQKYHTINPIDHQSKDGMSLMTLAANRETAVAVRLLYQRGLTTSNVSADGSSVLFSATGSSSGDAFTFLMGIGAVDNSSRPDGKKAIHEAVKTHWPTSSSKLATLLRAGEDPNTQISDGSTPLTLAAGNLNMEKLQLLAEHEKIDINCRDSRGMTPLMKCSHNLLFRRPDHGLSDRPHLVPGIECLIKHKADVALVNFKNEGTALHYLTAEGITSTSFDIVKLLVASGASLHSRDKFGLTPFEFLFSTCTKSARKARSFIWSEDFTPNNVLRFIINHACDHLNDHLSVGIPPLTFALKNSEYTTVELLLAKEEVSVDIRSRDNDQLTALEIAASSGCTEGIARALLSRTDNPMSTLDPLRGYTLLHFAACDLEDQQMLRILLERGVDIETLNKAGETALHTAILKNNLAAVRLLLAAGADATAVSGSSAKCSLYLAADAGNLPIVEALIRFGADINTSSTDTRSTALHIASRRAPWGLISFLIRHGGNIDGRDITGATPYIVAVKANRWDIVRKFVKTTADLSATDFDGLGAIHYAIMAGSVLIVQFLQRHGISLSQDIRDHDGNSHGNTLTCACMLGSIDLFQTVWENGVTDCTNDYGWGLAHFSVRAQVEGVRSLLLSQNVDWTLNTASVTFQSKPNVDWAPNTAALTFHSKLPSSRDIQGLLPLHVAAAIGNDAALNFLSHNKLIPDMDAITTGVEGYSSLHLATTFNRLSSVSLLTRLGSDINLKAKVDEETALHIAARLGFIEIVSALLEMGCQPNPVDANGMTPESLAIENDRQEIATILGSHLDSLGPQQEAKEDADLSVSVLGTGRGKTWRISIAQGAHIRKLIT
jgi:ankyrin repeat protein